MSVCPCMGHKLRVRLAILGYTRPASHVKSRRGSHCDADFLHIEHLANIERFCDCIKILLRNYYAPMVKRERGVYKAEGKACREQVLPHTSTILAKPLNVSSSHHTSTLHHLCMESQLGMALRLFLLMRIDAHQMCINSHKPHQE